MNNFQHYYICVPLIYFLVSQHVTLHLDHIFQLFCPILKLVSNSLYSEKFIWIFNNLLTLQ